MDSTLRMRIGCYAWLLDGKLAFRWASTKDRATVQLREDFGRDVQSMIYLGMFGTVDAAERAAADWLMAQWACDESDACEIMAQL